MNLPANVDKILSEFTEDAKRAFGANLVSVILYGSAAEDKLRPSSDVNLMLVLKTFVLQEAAAMQQPLRKAHAEIDLNVMFILEEEINLAAEAFAVKFSDILSRNRILWGTNPLTSVNISRESTISRLRQVLLNMRMRLRERYVMVGLREEQLSYLIADVAGPLRASAMTILHLEGTGASSPKEALEKICMEFQGRKWDDVLHSISTAREEGLLAPGTAENIVFDLIHLTKELQSRLEKLK
jgi:predicted nucleotidyltransferase